MDARWFAFAAKLQHWAAGESTDFTPKSFSIADRFLDLRRLRHTVKHDVGPALARARAHATLMPPLSLSRVSSCVAYAFVDMPPPVSRCSSQA
jgi:hypothetical protein